MADNLQALVGKLNTVCQESLSEAAGLCLSRTNDNVEIEHWLLKLLEAPTPTCRGCSSSTTSTPGRSARELTHVARQARAAAPTPGPELSMRAARGWHPRGVDCWRRSNYSAYQRPLRPPARRPAHRSQPVGAAAWRPSPELAKIPAEQLRQDLPALDRRRGRGRGRRPAATAAAGGGRPRPAGTTPRRRRWTSSRSTSPAGAKRARSTRSSAATSRSAR